VSLFGSMRSRLGVAVTCLDLGRRFVSIFLVNSAEALFEQLKAGIPALNNDSGNQPAVAIDRVRPEFEIASKHQFTHCLFGSLAERLSFLRGIDKRYSHPHKLVQRAARSIKCRIIICISSALNDAILDAVIFPKAQALGKTSVEKTRHGSGNENKRLLCPSPGAWLL
jgi:hypothetical protein